MLELNFPDSPAAGDTYTDAGCVWLFDSVKWTAMALGGGAVDNDEGTYGAI